MSIRLFNLKNVPPDEADDVRKLLQHHELEFYETPERIWGFSVPAIWLKDEAQLPAARALLDQYQAERAVTEREKYLLARQRGEAEGVIDLFKRHPLRYIAYCVAIFAVLYLSTKPFLSFFFPS